jgi:predicted AlkP superfamily phosphohydrolase/phosphomutase
MLLTAPAVLAESPRVVVLGFDGMDAQIVEQMMAAGRLPNLAALKARGGYSPLTPSIPAQTPVSWATFSTGLDPGGHEIFDFLKRDPADRVPTFAVAEEISVPFLLGKGTPVALGGATIFVFGIVGSLLFLFRRRIAVLVLCEVVGFAAGAAIFLAARAWLPAERPGVRNNRKGSVFWAEPGAKPATVMRVPVSFPPDRFDAGHELSGLGVPDISGRIGKPFYVTSDPFFTPRVGNDFSVDVVKLESNSGRQTIRIAGPPGRPFGREGAIDLPVTLTSTGSALEIEVAGERVTLKPGEWSGWVSFPFRVNPLVTVHGYGRFRLQSISPEIALYVSPIQFDPERLPPGLALSYPPSFAPGLVREFGRFKTMGWAIDTWSIQSGTLPEQAFLEDVDATVATDRKMLDRLLASRGKLLFHYFEFTDRVAHVFWRLRDPEHPAYDAKLAEKYADAVEKSYETADAIVGDALKAVGSSPTDVLLVLSDHGFATWRRSVNYNTWLVENGYLVLTGGASRKSLEALFSHGKFWDNVDWSKSRAYAMGLGDLYVNLKGREAGGIVEPGAPYEALRKELIERMTAMADPKNGARAVSRVFKREEVYRRFDPRVIPDLIVTNTRGYRVSWQSSLGVPTATVFEDNTDVWSGDHCSVDPDLVRGILFSSKPFKAERPPGIADVTASVRALLGDPSPAEAAGKALW